MLHQSNNRLRVWLGLSKEGREARAREQGFDTSRVVYHGTASDITFFDPSKAGQATGRPTAQLGVWVAHSPDVAADYALLAARRRVDSQATYPVLRRSSRPGHFVNQGHSAREIYDTLAQAKDDGYTSVIVSNFDSTSKNGPSTIEVIFDPSDIRSVHAAFDPDKAGSSNLLASSGLPAAANGLRDYAGGIGGAGYGAANPQDFDGDGEITGFDRLATAALYGTMGNLAQRGGERVFSKNSSAGIGAKPVAPPGIVSSSSGPFKSGPYDAKRAALQAGRDKLKRGEPLTPDELAAVDEADAWYARRQGKRVDAAAKQQKRRKAERQAFKDIGPLRQELSEVQEELRQSKRHGSRDALRISALE